MTIEEALAIVIELAEQNVITAMMARTDEGLARERKRQVAAMAMVCRMQQQKPQLNTKR